MEIKAYVCPQCGASLEVGPDTTFTFCPHCGSRLHISYKGKTPPADPNLRQFTASDTGVRLATAIVPEGFERSGALSSEWQSDYVPYTAVIHAASRETGITMLSTSREMFTDYCSPALKGLIQLSTTVIRSSLRTFMEPDEYLTAWASQMTGMTLTPIARATLPTPFAAHPETEASLLHGQFQQTASLEAGMGYHLVNLACEPLLIKYRAQTPQGDFLVLCGGEICGYEISTGMFHVPEGITNAVGKAFSGVKDALAGVTQGTGSAGSGSGIAGMTFNDWMRGGLVGKMMRERKARQQASPDPGQQTRTTAPQQPQNREIPPDGRIPLGHAKEYGKQTDIIVWGSARRYLLCAPAE